MNLKKLPQTASSYPISDSNTRRRLHAEKANALYF